MTGCSAPNCKNSTIKGYKVYNFPKESVRQALWVENVSKFAAAPKSKRWEPSKFSRLCEVHFEHNQFENQRQDGKRKLKPNAVPTLFPTSLRTTGTTRKKKKTIPAPASPAVQECAEKTGGYSGPEQSYSTPAVSLIGDGSAAAAEREQQQLQRVAEAAVAAVKFMESSSQNSSTNSSSGGLTTTSGSGNSSSGSSSGGSKIKLLPAHLTSILSSGQPKPFKLQLKQKKSSIVVCNKESNTSDVLKSVPSKVIKIKSSARLKQMQKRALDCDKNKTIKAVCPLGHIAETEKPSQTNFRATIHEPRIAGKNECAPLCRGTEKLISASDCKDPAAATALIILRKKLAVMTAINASLVKANRRLLRVNHKLVKSRQGLETAARAVFNDDQLRALGKLSTRGWNWSDLTIKNALMLKFACGINGYKELLSQRYPLPSLRTLQRRVASAVQSDTDQEGQEPSDMETSDTEEPSDTSGTERSTVYDVTKNHSDEKPISEKAVPVKLESKPQQQPVEFLNDHDQHQLSNGELAVSPHTSMNTHEDNEPQLQLLTGLHQDDPQYMNEQQEKTSQYDLSHQQLQQENQQHKFTSQQQGSSAPLQICQDRYSQTQSSIPPISRSLSKPKFRLRQINDEQDQSPQEQVSRVVSCHATNSLTHSEATWSSSSKTNIVGNNRKILYSLQPATIPDYELQSSEHHPVEVLPPPAAAVNGDHLVSTLTRSGLVISSSTRQVLASPQTALSTTNCVTVTSTCFSNQQSSSRIHSSNVSKPQYLDQQLHDPIIAPKAKSPIAGISFVDNLAGGNPQLVEQCGSVSSLNHIKPPAGSLFVSQRLPASSHQNSVASSLLCNASTAIATSRNVPPYCMPHFTASQHSLGQSTSPHSSALSASFTSQISPLKELQPQTTLKQTLPEHLESEPRV